VSHVLTALLIGWFAFNFLSAASRVRGEPILIAFNALIYLSLAIAVTYISRH